jgi:hypothetical protein
VCCVGNVFQVLASLVELGTKPTLAQKLPSVNFRPSSATGGRPIATAPAMLTASKTKDTEHFPLPGDQSGDCDDALGVEEKGYSGQEDIEDPLTQVASFENPWGISLDPSRHFIYIAGEVSEWRV